MLKELAISFEYMNGVSFNNKEHIEDFLNYLFRTDKQQKWTNELTINNLFMIKVKGELRIINFPSSIEDRLKIKEMLHRLLLKKLENNPLESFKNDIIYIDVHDKETGDNYEHLLNPEQTKSILSNVVEVEKDSEGNLFFVAHLDQKENVYHMHTVYIEQ